MKIASVVLFFCLTTPLLAQQVDPPETAEKASIVLVAPSSARLGELVRFDVSASQATSFKWLLVPESQDFEVYADGRKAVFSARTPGEYRFVIAAAYKDTVDVITHVVTVRGPPTRPASDSIKEWLPFWLYPLNLPDVERHALSDAFHGVTTLQGLTTPEEWSKATQVAVKAALGENITAWTPLLQKIATAIDKNPPTTPEQHRAVWLEIAEGLRNG